MRSFRDRFLTGREGEPLEIIDLGSLDVNGSYRPLFSANAWRYRGLDLCEGPNVDLVLRQPYRWSGIAANSVDVCISGQALEHIPLFWLVALEIERVLKPGGLACVIAPSGGYEHRYPVDCWRFYPDGFRTLSDFSGLQVEEIHTDWTPRDDYPDDSAAWKDSVWVARKPRRSRPGQWRMALRRTLLQYLSIRKP
jgi:SAM-dependent methyltransferase